MSKPPVRRALTAAAVLLLAFASCSSPNSLDGSVAEAFDLAFSSVQIRRSPKAVAISYLRSHGNEIVINLTVDLEGLNVTHGGDVNLAEEYLPGHQRAAVSRAVDNEPVRALPGIARGTLSLDHDPTPGQESAGSFSLSFKEDGDMGGGRTLVGTFDATVEGTAY